MISRSDDGVLADLRRAGARWARPRPEPVTLWLTGHGHGVDYGVRLKFTGCDAATIDDVLARLEIAW